MAFKDFSNFSTALAGLKEQLDKNALLVRVINRVSTIINNCQQVPGAYTTKYNAVQLLEYDSNGKLQDATPTQQLTIPQSVLEMAVADIESNQRLVESDLRVASALPLPVQVDVDTVDVASSTTPGSNTKVLSSGEAIVTLKDDNTAKLSFMQDIYPDPLPIWLNDQVGHRVIANAGNANMWISSIRYLSDTVTLIQVVDDDAIDNHGLVMVRSKLNLEGTLTSSYTEVGTVIASTTKKFSPLAPFRVKLGPNNTLGFQSGVFSLIEYNTLNLLFLFTQADRKSSSLDTGVVNFRGVADLSQVLYPKTQIDTLKDSLK